MSQRNLLDKMKDKLNDAVDELVLTDKEKEERETAMLFIKGGQYLLLALGVVLIIRNESYRGGIGTLLCALFFEKAVSQAAKAFGDETTSRHIAGNYSSLTKLTNIFKPITDAIYRDTRNIEKRVKRFN